MKIWVGIDGSKQSQNVLYWAMRHANEHVASATGDGHATIQPVLCWRYPKTYFGNAARLAPFDAAERLARLRAARIVEGAGLLPSDGLEVGEPLVVEGDTADILVELAQPDDLIVVGSRGLGGVRGLVLASVSSKVAGHARCALAIVPHDWSPMTSPKDKIVVGVDRSGPSRAAASWAVHNNADSIVRLVHAFSAGPEAPRSVHARHEPEAVAFVESLAASLVDEAGSGAAVEAVAREGHAWRALLDEAAEADLLVLGAQRFHGVDRVLFGSVAQSVVHHIATPTLLIPGPDEVGW